MIDGLAKMKLTGVTDFSLKRGTKPGRSMIYSIYAVLFKSVLTKMNAIQTAALKVVFPLKMFIFVRKGINPSYQIS